MIDTLFITLFIIILFQYSKCCTYTSILIDTCYLLRFCSLVFVEVHRNNRFEDGGGVINWILLYLDFVLLDPDHFADNCAQPPVISADLKSLSTRLPVLCCLFYSRWDARRIPSPRPPVAVV
ncbi:hypothetical protein CSKR_104598 [Clonorchis sinensis]|uniref:Uncharacterized protein n=1 Tax=Clonorchis sinensis TaxID=79923 RepID=A0A3R7GC08_CLOSI|nr:hypothetical protein CSKR_104598 [Clonorchis sinensis]